MTGSVSAIYEIAQDQGLHNAFKLNDIYTAKKIIHSTEHEVIDLYRLNDSWESLLELMVRSNNVDLVPFIIEKNYNIRKKRCQSSGVSLEQSHTLLQELKILDLSELKITEEEVQNIIEIVKKNNFIKGLKLPAPYTAYQIQIDKYYYYGGEEESFKRKAKTALSSDNEEKAGLIITRYWRGLLRRKLHSDKFKSILVHQLPSRATLAAKYIEQIIFLSKNNIAINHIVSHWTTLSNLANIMKYDYFFGFSSLVQQEMIFSSNGTAKKSDLSNGDANVISFAPFLLDYLILSRNLSTGFLGENSTLKPNLIRLAIDLQRIEDVKKYNQFFKLYDLQAPGFTNHVKVDKHFSFIIHKPARKPTNDVNGIRIEFFIEKEPGEKTISAKVKIARKDSIFYGDIFQINMFCLSLLFNIVDDKIVDKNFKKEFENYLSSLTKLQINKLLIIFAQAITVFSEYDFNGALRLTPHLIHSIYIHEQRKLIQLARLSLEEYEAALLKAIELNSTADQAMTYECLRLDDKNDIYLYDNLISESQSYTCDYSDWEESLFDGNAYLELRPGKERLKQIKTKNLKTIDLLDELKKKNPQPVNSQISQSIKAIKKRADVLYYDQSFYGNAALNRRMLLDKEIAQHLTAEVIAYLFTNEPTVESKIDRNFTPKGVALSDAIYYGFAEGLHVLKFMPNNESDYGPEAAQKQKADFELNVKPILVNISKAANVDAMESEQEFNLNILKKQFEHIVRAINLLKETDPSQLLFQVPGHTPAAMRNQVTQGFEQLCQIMQVALNNNKLENETLDGFCEKFLHNPKAMLNGTVSHLFYDRAHLIAALEQNTRISIGNTDYTYQDLFRKIIEKITLHPDHYPAYAKEQFSLRVSLVASDLKKRFPQAFESSANDSENLHDAPYKTTMPLFEHKKASRYDDVSPQVEMTS